MGIAFSFPGFFGGEFDVGMFFELTTSSVDGENHSFGIGGTGRLTFELGYEKGSVCDLAGRGFETGMQIPITPIPGTAIPNPIGPSIGASANFDDDGFTGVGVSAGIGTEVGSRGGYTAVGSAKHGFIGFYD